MMIAGACEMRLESGGERWVEGCCQWALSMEKTSVIPHRVTRPVSHGRGFQSGL